MATASEFAVSFFDRGTNLLCCSIVPELSQCWVDFKSALNQFIRRPWCLVVSLNCCFSKITTLLYAHMQIMFKCICINIQLYNDTSTIQTNINKLWILPRPILRQPHACASSPQGDKGVERESYSLSVAICSSFAGHAHLNRVDLKSECPVTYGD